MRRWWSVILATGWASVAAAVPLQITHQGRLMDPSGAPVEGTQSVVFRLYATSSGGSAIWTETRTVSAQDGYFAVRLGEVTPLTEAVFPGDTRYLSVQVGSNPEPTARMAMVSVPYAVSAGSVMGGVARVGDTLTDACTSAEAGTMRFNDGNFEFCVGDGAWRRPALINGGDGSDSAHAAKTCKTLHLAYPSLPSNAYWIDPDEGGAAAPFRAWCDMTTSPGGWTLLLSYDHKTDQISGSPNLLTYNWNATTPSPTTDYARDWSVVPNTLFTNGSSQILLKRMGTGDTQAFTVREWVGWNVTCNQWRSSCIYANKMNMYAVVGHPSFAHDYYFHACNGQECHGTDTYEAVGVDCHAFYPSNYGHPASGLQTYPGSTNNNCPTGRDPDLWGFGASSPQGVRQGGWGSGTTHTDIGRVAYFFRE